MFGVAKWCSADQGQTYLIGVAWRSLSDHRTFHEFDVVEPHAAS